MRNKKIGITIRRILFVVFPLFSVACYSAPEWPARVAMMDGRIRDMFYEPAIKWQNAVATVSTKFISSKTNEDTSEIAKNDYKEDTSIVNEPAVNIKNEAIEKQEIYDKEEKSPVVMNADIKEKTDTAPTIKTEEKSINVNSILTVGDSLMSEIASGLRYGLSKDIKIKDIHKSSTGLTNSEYYDWPTVASNAVKQYQPNLVIIHMGGNDGQDMKIGKRFVHITDQEWQDAYYVRAMNLIKEIKKADPNSHIVWLGLPAMRDTKFAKKQDIIRSIQMKASLDSDIEYLDSKKALGEEYSKEGMLEGKRVVIRRTDGIHYSRDGGEILARFVVSDKDLQLKWK